MIFDGPVGVVDLTFDGTYLGRTTAATTIEDDKDWLDIIYQQTGTKPDDKTETGLLKKVVATFGEITTARIAKLVNGVTVTGGGTLKFGKNSYTSLKTTKAKRLEVVKVNSAGVQSTDPFDKIVMYLALPEITGAIAWDAAAQIAMPITFHCFSKKITNSKTSEEEYVFGFNGVSSSAGIPNS